MAFELLLWISRKKVFSENRTTAFASFFLFLLLTFGRCCSLPRKSHWLAHWSFFSAQNCLRRHWFEQLLDVTPIDSTSLYMGLYIVFLGKFQSTFLGDLNLLDQVSFVTSKTYEAIFRGTLLKRLDPFFRNFQGFLFGYIIDNDRCTCTGKVVSRDMT